MKKKNKHKHKTEHKTEHETKHKTEHETPICVQYFYPFMMLQRLDTFIPPPMFKKNSKTKIFSATKKKYFLEISVFLTGNLNFILQATKSFVLLLIS